jgi:hypothetical protein
VKRPDAARLYRLPNEKSDVGDECREVVKEMDSWLDTEDALVKTGADIDIGDEVRSRLADLGYLDQEM